MITKEERVAASVRQKIVDGVWQPGSPLPTFTQLELEYPASRLTLQKAMQRLKRMNFIETRERQGMAVSKRPPHLHRYGLLLAYHERYNHFWSALLHDAYELAEERGSEFVIFRNLSHGNYDPAECQRLLEEIDEQCLAGLFSVFDLEQSPIAKELAKADLPQVGLNSVLRPDSQRVHLDNAQLMARALEWFAAQGRRRIAMITRGTSTAPLLPLFDAAIRKRPEMRSPSAWRHPFYDSASAEAVVELLLSLPAETRPDGLLIADDTLLDPAARGIIKSGLQLPEDLAILAHCNWGAPIACPLPVTRLGFETRSIVERAVELIDARRQGSAQLPDPVIPAVFESELSAPVGSNPAMAHAFVPQP